MAHTESHAPSTTIHQRCLAVLTVRNEGAFLLDWLAHHRAVGFNSFLVFSNNCQDGTDAMLDRLQKLGWVTHLRNDGPYHERGIQFTALKTAQKHPLVHEADWILPLDIDEYVNVKLGSHRLDALFERVPSATAITLTWRLFGNNGAQRFEDLPITQRFTHCAPEAINWPWRAVMFKTLYRNDGTYGALGVHRPRRPDTEKLAHANWVDSSGRPLGENFKTKRIFSDYGRPNYEFVQLNHYPLGDMESYVLKSDRGRAVHADDKLGMDYWVERNFNTVEDTSILALADAAASFKAKMMADDVISRLHNAAVAWRKSRFEHLMEQDDYRSLYGRLLMSGSSRQVTVQEAKFMINFALRGSDS